MTTNYLHLEHLNSVKFIYQNQEYILTRDDIENVEIFDSINYSVKEDDLVTTIKYIDISFVDKNNIPICSYDKIEVIFNNKIFTFDNCRLDNVNRKYHLINLCYKLLINDIYPKVEIVDAIY